MIDGHAFREQFDGERMSESVSMPVRNSSQLKKPRKRSLPVRNSRLQKPTAGPEEERALLCEFKQIADRIIRERKPYRSTRFARLKRELAAAYRRFAKRYHVPNRSPELRITETKARTSFLRPGGRSGYRSTDSRIFPISSSLNGWT